MAQVTLGTGRRGSHSKAGGKAQSGDPAGQRSEQEGTPPHPQVLTWNTPAGRHGAGTVCSPRATMLLMSRARCENHAERPRGRRCTCSREAAEPALALATVSESPPCGEQCGPIREDFLPTSSYFAHNGPSAALRPAQHGAAGLHGQRAALPDVTAISHGPPRVPAKSSSPTEPK